MTASVLRCCWHCQPFSITTTTDFAQWSLLLLVTVPVWMTEWLTLFVVPPATATTTMEEHSTAQCTQHRPEWVQPLSQYFYLRLFVVFVAFFCSTCRNHFVAWWPHTHCPVTICHSVLGNYHWAHLHLLEHNSQSFSLCLPWTLLVVVCRLFSIPWLSPIDADEKCQDRRRHAGRRSFLSHFWANTRAGADLSCGACFWWDVFVVREGDANLLLSFPRTWVAAAVGQFHCAAQLWITSIILRCCCQLHVLYLAITVRELETRKSARFLPSNTQLLSILFQWELLSFFHSY